MRELVAQYLSKSISRRGFVSRLAKTGVSLAAAQSVVVACETNSIKQLIELIRRADLFIGGDTGPLHIASILGIPIVGIYGPKDPVIYGPYHGKAVVVRKELWCSPCQKRTCSDPECMTSILPEDVFHAVNKLMEECVAGRAVTSPHKDTAIKESTS